MCGLRFWAKHELERSDYDKNYPHVDISPQCEWCLAIILFQMCVLRFLKWSRAKEISDMYGLCSAIFFSDVRFAVFWNEAQLKKSLTCMVCVWPFYFRWAFCVFLKWSRAKEISDMYGLRSAILFQMCVLRFWNQAELKKSLTCMVCVRPFLFQMCVFRFLKWSRAKEISDLWFAFGHFHFRCAFCVFLKSSRAKEISDMYGLCSAIFISDVRFEFFEMKQS